MALGFDAVCTGHHARLENGLLRRSVDNAKDQSYVLAVLTRDQLARAMFPLGDTTKAEVRIEAAQRGLGVADKPDSHDVCFIADGDTRGFLTRQLGEAPGPIVDSSGATLGSHDGAYAFTVGQRRGLRLDHPADDGRPRYVLGIEPVTRTVTVGTAEELEVRDITAQRPVWTGCDPFTTPRECEVQLRAHGEVYPCESRLDGEDLTISLTEPARGVATGQTAVLYDGDTVLGSATITATRVPVSLAGPPGCALKRGSPAPLVVADRHRAAHVRAVPTTISTASTGVVMLVPVVQGRATVSLCHGDASFPYVRTTATAALLYICFGRQAARLIRV